MIELNTIYNENCLDSMARMDDNSVDMILTSPPYEDIAGAGYAAVRKDILFFKLYSDFLTSVLRESYRILKPSGQIFLNIKSKTFNKTIKTPHWIEFVGGFELFLFKSYIIWKYAGSFDSTKERFHLDYEIVYHLAKGDKIYLNQDCGYDDPLTSVWYIPHNISNRLHPTQMPEKLAERIIKTASKKGDLIYDPFGGSGTTVKMCILLNRQYIMSEISAEYCEIARERIEPYICQQHLI